MFNKTSSRIKHFISPRRSKKALENDEWLHGEDMRSKRNLSLKSIDESFVGWTNGNGALPASPPLTPSPLSTRCSFGPFCECGCTSPIRSPPHSLLRFDPRPGTSKDLCQRRDESPQLNLASQSPSAIAFLPNNTSVNASHRKPSAPQLNFLEALALEPGGEDNEPSHKVSPMPRNTSSERSSDDQQLMRDTSSSFELSEFALIRPPATRQELYPSQDPPSPRTRKMSPRLEPRGQLRVSGPRKVISFKHQSALPQEHEEQPADGSSSVLRPSVRSESIPTLVEARQPASFVSSREYFQHTMLNKRAEQDGISHVGVVSRAQSPEASRGAASGSAGPTPFRPFSLEDFPTDLKMASGQFDDKRKMHLVRRPAVSLPALPLHNPASARSLDAPPSFILKPRQALHEGISSKHQVVLKSTNFSLTSLGYKHGDIRVEMVKSEMNSMTRSSSSLAASHTTTSGQLESTSTSPSTSSPSGTGRDDDLDMPGFQAAISGATSYGWMQKCEDCLADGPHPRLEDLEVKVDELLEWCDEFGLHMGELVMSDDPLPGEEIDREGEVAAAQKRRQRRRQVSARGVGAGEGKGGDTLRRPPCGEALMMEEEKAPLRPGRGEKDEREEEEIRDDEASLPPSPMQIIGPSALARSGSIVPMGSNINHDLRDYLKWKNECVNSNSD